MLKAKHYNCIKEMKTVGTNKELLLTIISFKSELERRNIHKDGLFLNDANIVSSSHDKGGDFSRIRTSFPVETQSSPFFINGDDND